MGTPNLKRIVQLFRNCEGGKIPRLFEIRQRGSQRQKIKTYVSSHIDIFWVPDHTSCQILDYRCKFRVAYLPVARAAVLAKLALIEYTLRKACV